MLLYIWKKTFEIFFKTQSYSQCLQMEGNFPFRGKLLALKSTGGKKERNFKITLKEGNLKFQLLFDIFTFIKQFLFKKRAFGHRFTWP